MKKDFTVAILIHLFLLISMNVVQAQLPEPKYTTINQTKLCWYEQGAGSVILLLHGWPQTSYVWRKVIPQLSKHNRVIAIDLPGMGNSGFTSAYDTQAIATLIHEFIRQQKIEKFNLVGHDVGAWIATAYAFEYAGDLKSLTVIDAGIPGLINPAIFQPENAAKVWQFYFHAVNDIPEMLIAGKEKEYLNWYFSNKSFIKNSISREDLEVYTKAFKGADKLKHGFAYYRAFPESVKKYQNISIRLNIPVLAIGGDHALAYSVGDALKKVADHVTSISIKDCGHYVPEEQPEILIRLISSHVESNNQMPLSSGADKSKY